MNYLDDLKTVLELFKEKTPGTYTHCQIVAELCENIGKELGINTDDLVVAATLHDIGKCINPTYFIENINDDENPHNKLEPSISFQILSRHLSDSVLKLTQLNIPNNIIKIVSEHHGNTLIKFIYNKAQKKYTNIVEEHYRYRSTKPTSIEAAILMCTDVVESATRALYINNKLDNIKEVIDKLINDLINDTQLDILKLGELRIIKQKLTSEIKNTYHKRLDYEEEQD